MFNSIANFFKNQNKFDLLVVFLSISVFLPIPLSNLGALACFVFTIAFFEKFVKPDKYFIALIFYFFLTIVSFFWSIYPEHTLKSIPRNIFFLIIPLFFIKRRVLNSLKVDFVLKQYSLFCVFISVVFIVRALVRFGLTGEISYFFFHGDYSNDFGLVPKELNAIHVSAFISLSYFYLLTKTDRSKVENIAMIILLLFLLLLNSTNIIFITLLLSFVYYFFYSKQANRMRLRNVMVLFFCISSIFLYKKAERFLEIEFKSSISRGIGHNVIDELPNESQKVTLYEAWNNEKFTPNDFFPGTAFRVYQARLFRDFLKEDNIFWKGFGYNASQIKIEEKGIVNNVFLGNETREGYQKKNFHNQYIQTFAELGIIGFFILTMLLVFSLIKAIKTKDFIHIAFTILMISLFLTESFLMRQRGIVFFVLFYCLFMSQGKEKLKKIE